MFWGGILLFRDQGFAKNDFIPEMKSLLVSLEIFGHFNKESENCCIWEKLLLRLRDFIETGCSSKHIGMFIETLEKNSREPASVLAVQEGLKIPTGEETYSACFPREEMTSDKNNDVDRL